MTTPRLSGVLAPVITPFTADLEPDPGRFVRHCRWLLDHGCRGLAVFGTNSEANSLSVDERIMLLDALVAGGIPPEALLPGTGCCALPESVRLTAHAVKLGCAGVLMLPPFYYKGVSDEGLYRAFGQVIERVGDARLRVYLYHIPPVAQVPITLALIERLLTAYPDTVAGVKDSGGDWANTQAMITAFAGRDFDVFAGSETFLLQNLRAGGAGCITATGNVNPGAIDHLYRSWRSADADRLQAELTATRAVLQQVSMIPALKATVAHFGSDPAWRTVRPPLVELTSAETHRVIDGLTARGFTMAGLRGPAS